MEEHRLESLAPILLPPLLNEGDERGQARRPLTSTRVVQERAGELGQPIVKQSDEKTRRNGGPRVAFKGHEETQSVDGEQLRAVADRIGVSVAQVAIAWVAAQGDDIVPLVGARRRSV